MGAVQSPSLVAVRLLSTAVGSGQHWIVQQGWRTKLLFGVV